MISRIARFPHGLTSGAILASWAAIAIMGWFIFSSTDGNITVQGDDVFFIARVKPFSLNYFKEIPGRGYLTPFYTLVFDLCGRNTQYTHIFYFTVFALSGCIWYVVLRKILGARAALVGAMFYLAYAGKHETITWISAGAYLIIATVFFLSVWIALSRLNRNPWTAALAITGLNWVAVHLCELLIVAAPLYPVCYWTHARLSGRRPQRAALAATFLPLAMFLTHAGLIYLNTPKGAPPLWLRGVNARADAGVLMRAAGNALRISARASVGSDHADLVRHGVKGFLRYVPGSRWKLAMLVLSGTLAAWVLLWQRQKPPAGNGLSRAVVVTVLIAGIYLTFLSPLVGSMQFALFMPSRMLTLAGVGLSLLAALLAAVLTSASRARAVLTLPVLLLVGAEAMTMNSILYEHQTSWAYDSRIREQLLASGIRPRLGDTIYLSLPEHPLQTYWRTGFSQFEGGHAQVLLVLDYGMLLGNYPVPIERRLFLKSVRRSKENALPVATSDLPDRTFAFYVRDGDYKLIPLGTLGPGSQSPVGKEAPRP